MTVIYDFSVRTVNGEEKLLQQYENYVMLIVNTASKCGFTPQFEQLQLLYDRYKDKQFVVLGFPCSQFANQEFASSDEAVKFCEINYNVTFPMFAKINVNGKDEHPLYTFLKNSERGILTKRIKWNFTKFLINRSGEVVGRYSPMADPLKLQTKIKQLF